ncbi:TonB-dependent receptor [Chondromyces apiculatus]|uniref:Protein oar n=1 Tax=Chondromyces apiculatus DSM 436 TaxID=1192034 RepID=A0A017T5U5_9BACT|nr:carboxypeptidase-like regulatory domain-containing protein [Chondromyces apiculatus]EYF04564.1 Protein oar precursor [Chondromyces apiculatus DSM 436]
MNLHVTDTRTRLSHTLRGLGVALLVVAAVFLVAFPAFAQGNSVLIGRVVDASTRAPIADVAVTATAPELQGEQIVVTDGSGQYRIPNLPPGNYTLRFDRESFRPYARGGIALRTSTTIRVNVELLPTVLDSGDPIVVIGRAPTVDVGSSSTGQNINQDFMRRLAVAPPSSKGGAQRSFEAVAEVAPGARADTYGTSVNGATSPENQYVIDGLSVNDPAYGVVGTPLTIEFIKGINVISGGYMPEFGRSTGGVLDVVTKSGGDEFQGSVFFNLTPGVFAGQARPVKSEGSTVSTDHRLSSIRDYGFELGGPIVKEKLWFFAGVDLAFTSRELERNLNSIRGFDENDQPLTDENGFTLTDRIPGTTQRYRAEALSVQFIGKLTYQVNQDNSLTLSVYGAPSVSGGDGTFGIAPASDAVEGRPGLNLSSTYSNSAHKYVATALDVALKWSTAFDNKRLLIDTTLGWHHQDQDILPSDGSRPGTQRGYAGTRAVVYRRIGPYHSITDFERLPADQAARCALQPAATDLDQDGALDDVRVPCPVQLYYAGGPNFLKESTLDRLQLKSVVTALFEGLGHHVVKAGIDGELMTYQNLKTLSGRQLLIESVDGTAFVDSGVFGFLSGPRPDDYHIVDAYDVTSLSTTVGGFVQDSWSILDKVTLNLGVRYDAQVLIANDGEIGMVLANQWSPRLGVIYDVTQEGRSKLFASYARYYESVPLNIVDRLFGREQSLISIRPASACDPRDPSTAEGCLDPSTRLPIGAPYDPNQYSFPFNANRAVVDPDLSPQSSDELVLGGELEVVDSGRVGLTYTKRWLNAIIETMSVDEGGTFFVGNPGRGFTADVPEATRDYDAVTVFFQKAFTNLWLAQVSYTVSYLRGNYSGLFRPETGQLDPNMNTDFDVTSLLVNRTGPLPGDRTHEIKIFGAKTFEIPGGMLLDLGLTARTQSGSPTNFLGTQSRYGANEVFLLPRGSGERLPWNHSLDGHLGYGFRLAKDSDLLLAVDVFNIMNFQAAIATDNSYTLANVLPCTGENDGPDNVDQCVRYLNGAPFDPNDKNPNFGNPTAYQQPRTWRFGARVTF